MAVTRLGAETLVSNSFTKTTTNIGERDDNRKGSSMDSSQEKRATALVEEHKRKSPIIHETTEKPKKALLHRTNLALPSQF